LDLLLKYIGTICGWWGTRLHARMCLVLVGHGAEGRLGLPVTSGSIWLLDTLYIYIYIYIEREREREKSFM
jgi:hypothetical protein